MMLNYLVLKENLNKFDPHLRRCNCKKVLNNNLTIPPKRDSGSILIRKRASEIPGDFRIYNLFDVIIGLQID